jgi:hypothetical protein
MLQARLFEGLSPLWVQPPVSPSGQPIVGPYFYRKRPKAGGTVLAALLMRDNCSFC